MENYQRPGIFIYQFGFAVLLSLGSVYFSPWFAFFETRHSVFLIGIVLISILCIVALRDEGLNYIRRFEYSENLIYLISAIFFFVYLLFPVRNMNLGDGVLLQENVALESGLFGYLLTMDELIEAMIHSYLFGKFFSGSDSPLVVFRIVSTFLGSIFLLLSARFFIRQRLGALSYIAFLSCPGALVFHGYAEHYSFVNLLLFIFCIFGYETLLKGERKGLPFLIKITALGAIGCLCHLVFGYIIFSLVLLSYLQSKKGDFWKNSILCAFAGLFILFLPFAYFLFFADVRFDLSQTHITNPVFYPLKKIISTKHFKDMLFTHLFSSLPAFAILIDFIIIKRKELKLELFAKPILFLVAVYAGFLFHNFSFYPQLGFPADWDVMSFFWIPLSLFVLIYFSKQEEKYLFLPVVLFSLSFYFLTSYSLSRPDEKNIIKLHKTMSLVKEFISIEKNKISSLPPENKKFYSKISYFLFRTGKLSQESDKPEKEEILKENVKYKEELENGNLSDKAWKKEFLARLTGYHHRFLKLTE